MEKRKFSREFKIEAVRLITERGVSVGGLYVVAMTGNTVQLGLGVARMQWQHALTVATVLASFFAGGSSQVLFDIGYLIQQLNLR